MEIMSVDIYSYMFSVGKTLRLAGGLIQVTTTSTSTNQHYYLLYLEIQCSLSIPMSYRLADDFHTAPRECELVTSSP